MGITQGFRLGFNSPLSSLKSARKNLDGALHHPSDLTAQGHWPTTKRPLSQWLTLAALELFLNLTLPTSGD